MPKPNELNKYDTNEKQSRSDSPTGRKGSGSEQEKQMVEAGKYAAQQRKDRGDKPDPVRIEEIVQMLSEKDQRGIDVSNHINDMKKLTVYMNQGQSSDRLWVQDRAPQIKAAHEATGKPIHDETALALAHKEYDETVQALKTETPRYKRANDLYLGRIESYIDYTHRKEVESAVGDWHTAWKIAKDDPVTARCEELVKQGWNLDMANEQACKDLSQIRLPYPEAVEEQDSLPAGYLSFHETTQQADPSAPYDQSREFYEPSSTDKGKGVAQQENSDSPGEMARTTLEGSQEREKDDTSLVLGVIKIDTLKSLRDAIRDITGARSVFKPGHSYHETALSLRKDITKVIQFREGKKNAPKPEEAYTAMNRLLTEVPRMPTGGPRITAFLSEVDRIKKK